MVNVLTCAECSYTLKEYLMSYMTFKYPRHLCGWNTYLKLDNLHIYFTQNFISHWIFQQYIYHVNSVKTLFCLKPNQNYSSSQKINLLTAAALMVYQSPKLVIWNIFSSVTFIGNRENKRPFWRDLESNLM